MIPAHISARAPPFFDVYKSHFPTTHSALPAEGRLSFLASLGKVMARKSQKSQLENEKVEKEKSQVPALSVSVSVVRRVSMPRL